ncbi:Gfo/Idh/MocA family oxidoreductase [Paenibacillus sacheonensis]|uniref:Gfo/Idh/MocA family oxidoreductase n=1 Tax=Paenibacillus sacheonensis TaxID=742054 RepID=UPI00195ACD50|nr:putative dehydrogenase [Paenibacillus sacheonensis]
MGKLKIGFIGSGFMGQNAHLFNYAMLEEECEVVALAEPRAELAKKVAARYGISRIYANHTELLANEQLDAVIASQPFQRHAILIPDILRAGVPVFTEKPLTLSVEAGERLVKLGQETGALHVVGYHKRSDPAVEYAKALIDEWQASGEFGKLNYVRVSMPPGNWVGGADNALWTDEPTGATEWEPQPVPGMTEEETGSYDWFVNFYIHQINAIRYMLGEPYKLVYAARSGALLVGESDSGKCVTLEMGTYVTSTDWQESILVTFEKGFIKIELPAPLARQRAGKVTVFRDNGGTPTFTEPVLPNQGAMRKQAINFLAAVRGERPAPCTAEEALEDLKIARDYVLFMSKYKEESKV